MKRHQSMISVGELDINTIEENILLAAGFRTAMQHQKALALWQMPGCKSKHLVVDSGDNLSVGKIDLEETSPGFLFAPYHNPGGSNSILIRADLHLRLGAEPKVEHSSLFETDSKALLATWQDEVRTKSLKSPIYQVDLTPISSNEKLYCNTVAEALTEIERGTFQKVVPSVCQTMAYPKEFHPLEIFKKLEQQYPEAFKSLVSIPGIGTWIGVSPEPLIEVDKSKRFSTTALAGTQRYHHLTSLREVAWTQKEIEEQALVSRYIINCFKKIRLREFEEYGPKTVVAGNLLHLKTLFTVDMKAVNFLQLGSVMLELLHPTSAVCGMPREAAQEFLDRHEGFDRAFYSGYLGPVNINNEIHLYVNLRCMYLNRSAITLYAGAGVTADSNPVKEWQETQLKLDTLRSILQNP